MQLLLSQSLAHFSPGPVRAYAASMGGLATLVGTPPNLSFTRILAITFDQAPEVSFSNWMLLALTARGPQAFLVAFGHVARHLFSFGFRFRAL